MKSTTGTFPAEDGTALYWQLWEPEGGSLGTVCLCHGHGEHLGRYEHVARALCDGRLAVLAFDLRGHGRSGGPRGHTPSYPVLLRDLELTIDRASKDGPVFLYGHSMGANLALNLGVERRADVRGLVGTGPWLRLRFKPPASKLLLMQVMRRLYPAFTAPSGLDVKGLSHDPEVVRAYVEDPLVHDRISAMMGFGMIEYGERALERAAEFQLPCLLMHGEDDPIADPAATRLFYEKIGSRDKTLRMWPGLFHEIHNEPQQSEVLGVMVDWLRARL